MILDRIIEEKGSEISDRKGRLSLPQLKRLLESNVPPQLDFKNAISAQGVNLIAEIKKKSPLRGILRRDFKPVEIALEYAAAGAKALSVLTDEKFFGGRLGFMSLIKKETPLPILEKDFLIDEYQIYEARALWADAVLLIARVLSRQQLKDFAGLAAGLGMDVVCEAHSEEDLDKIMGIDAQIIGINNRNLDDFKVDLETTARLIRRIPRGKIIVSESGIKSHDDVIYLKNLGVNAVLIGETFIGSSDITATVREVMGYEK